MQEKSNKNNDLMNLPKYNVGDQISMQPSDWKFSKETVETFDEHIKKSIPHYEDCHKLAIKTSEFFLTHDSLVYDLGSTTGSFAEKLCHYYKHKYKLDIKCIEREPHFCEYSNNRINKSDLKKFHKIKFINDDISNLNLGTERSDLITSFFTMQFIKPNKRSKIIEKIYNSLNWGGAFIFFEKVRGADARFQDILSHLLSIEKLEKNFKHSEVLSKSLSLAGQMEPFSDLGNRQILSNAGFKDIDLLFRYINFQGYLCIK